MESVQTSTCWENVQSVSTQPQHDIHLYILGDVILEMRRQDRKTAELKHIIIPTNNSAELPYCWHLYLHFDLKLAPEASVLQLS